LWSVRSESGNTYAHLKRFQNFERGLIDAQRAQWFRVKRSRTR
jgi:hypothetical protein